MDTIVRHAFTSQKEDIDHRKSFAFRISSVTKSPIEDMVAVVVSYFRKGSPLKHIVLIHTSTENYSKVFLLLVVTLLSLLISQATFFSACSLLSALCFCLFVPNPDSVHPSHPILSREDMISPPEPPPHVECRRSFLPHFRFIFRTWFLSHIQVTSLNP